MRKHNESTDALRTVELWGRPRSSAPPSWAIFCIAFGALLMLISCLGVCWAIRPTYEPEPWKTSTNVVDTQTPDGSGDNE